ncbi:5'-methylthioadenosine/S-adenosylhomocysteine nucleosidase [Treponema pedis]|uniref:5'-methylthioadenosine/S-adenosylhomocysteine nucleosidase family protein n=1 Tax=Treponema pedis TaxID=409322 RepID=UPI000422EE67|nr:5'-methylthioadenosine/S-adenosylhomocysteine nucleosidase [Treponema pedis]
MKKAGILVAVEMKAIIKKYGKAKKTVNIRNFTVPVYEIGNYELFVLSSGAGEIAAAAGTQFLISECKVEVVFNFGIVGGLTESISEHRVCIVKNVVHYDFDTSQADTAETGKYEIYPSIYIPATPALIEKAVKIMPDLIPVTCASGDKFIANPEQKQLLHKQFNADICEMEAAGIILTCNMNKIPCMLIKMVSDGINGGAEEFYREFDNASMHCLDVIDTIIRSLDD